MKAVITVVGKDMVGILAKVSAFCAECNANVLEVSQTILQDMFCMIMLVDTAEMKVEFTEFSEKLEGAGKDLALSIHVMHEDIFNSMHRI